MTMRPNLLEGWPCCDGVCRSVRLVGIGWLCGSGFLALSVEFAFDDEFVGRRLQPVDCELGNKGSAIMVRISRGSRLLVMIVDAVRWCSTMIS
jgi:hypothetical protein